MLTRGVRGAVCAAENTSDAIECATQDLLCAILSANPSMAPEDVASVFFTMTDDLDATYPALAARQIGWVEVPLLCAREIAVPGSLARCIRIMMHWNTHLPQSQVRHVYLGAAAVLRPDLSGLLSTPTEGELK